MTARPSQASQASEFYEWIKALTSTGSREVTRAAATGIRTVMFGDWGHGAYPQAATVAELVGTSERTVRNRWAILFVEGWLKREKRPGKSDYWCRSLPNQSWEEPCRCGRNKASDEQDVLPRTSLLRPAASLNDAPASTGPLTTDDEETIRKACAEAQSSLGATPEQIDSAVIDLLRKREAGQLRGQRITERQVLGFVQAAMKERGKRRPSRQELEKQREEAVYWEAIHGTDLRWYRRLESAKVRELPALLEEWRNRPAEPTTFQHKEESVF